MSNTPKKVVQSFYESDLLNDMGVFAKYLHPEVELFWNSSFGFRKMDFDAIEKMFIDMSPSYESFRSIITHVLSEGDLVTLRYSFFGSTIERSGKEEPVGHFITIWELKDGKMFKGYQISQQGDLSPENLMSFISK